VSLTLLGSFFPHHKPLVTDHLQTTSLQRFQSHKISMLVKNWQNSYTCIAWLFAFKFLCVLMWKVTEPDSTVLEMYWREFIYFCIDTALIWYYAIISLVENLKLLGYISIDILQRLPDHEIQSILLLFKLFYFKSKYQYSFNVRLVLWLKLLLLD